MGAKRIRMELLRKPADGVVVPSPATINRILLRQGLVQPRPRKRPRDSYVRWERPAPMQLWQVAIVGGIVLVDPTTGVLREAKVVTGVDDHSRFCVIAAVVECATSRAVCLAFAEALSRFGVPEEVLSDIQSGWRGIRADLSAGGDDRCRPAPARHRCLTDWSAPRLLAC